MELRINLASRVYLDRRTVRRWLFLSLVLLALLLAVNILYGYRNVRQLEQVEQHITEMETRLVKQRGLQVKDFSKERFAEVMGEVSAANQIIAADRFRWTSLLGRFEELLPGDVAISSLTPDFRSRSLKISATARDEAGVKELLDRLLGSSDMNQVFLLSQATTEQPDGSYGVSFSLLIREAF